MAWKMLVTWTVIIHEIETASKDGPSNLGGPTTISMQTFACLFPFHMVTEATCGSSAKLTAGSSLPQGQASVKDGASQAQDRDEDEVWYCFHTGRLLKASPSYTGASAHLHRNTATHPPASPALHSPREPEAPGKAA